MCDSPQRLPLNGGREKPVEPVPGSQSVGTIEKPGTGRAGSGKNARALSNYFLPDPARPAPAFAIVPTDREP